MPLRDEFVRIQAEGWTYQLRPELAEPVFANLCALPTAVYSESVVPVVSSPNTEVRRFSYQGKAYFLKEYFFLGWKKHFKVLRRGEHLLRIATRMEEHGLLTPRIVGIGRNGRNRRVVTEAVEGAKDVWQVLYPDFEKHRGEVDDGFLQALGHTIGDLHRCGFFHGDLRWRNVLTRNDEGAWKFFFIDNDRTCWFRWGVPFRGRVKNLSQMLFSGLLLGWSQHEWRIFYGNYLDRAGLPQALGNSLLVSVEKVARRRLDERQIK